jgi:hypothetical protein
MVTLLITALAIFTIIVIGLYFSLRPKPAESEQILPPPPNLRGLFADEVDRALLEEQSAAAAAQTESLVARARNGERSPLSVARQSGNKDLYNRVLTELVNQAASGSQLLAIMSYVTQYNFPVNERLAEAVLDSWRTSPDRHSTAKALHFAALSDNAGVFRTAVEQALNLWREGKLSDLSPVELRALFDGEFWVLSSGIRSSGAGFVLKQTLADARRELEAAMRANQ